MRSKEYQLIVKDIKKIGIGALIAGGGAALTYLIEASPGVDLGQYTYIIMPVVMILLNTLRKYLTETIYK